MKSSDHALTACFLVIFEACSPDAILARGRNTTPNEDVLVLEPQDVPGTDTNTDAGPRWEELTLQGQIQGRSLRNNDLTPTSLETVFFLSLHYGTQPVSAAELRVSTGGDSILLDRSPDGTAYTGTLANYAPPWQLRLTVGPNERRLNLQGPRPHRFVLPLDNAQQRADQEFLISWAPSAASSAKLEAGVDLELLLPDTGNHLLPANSLPNSPGQNYRTRLRLRRQDPVVLQELAPNSVVYVEFSNSLELQVLGP